MVVVVTVVVAVADDNDDVRDDDDDASDTADNDFAVAVVGIVVAVGWKLLVMVIEVGLPQNQLSISWWNQEETELFFADTAAVSAVLAHNFWIYIRICLYNLC